MSKPVALVVGGGLKGIVAARRLIDRGYQVRLIEKGKGFGGIMSGMKWDGFTLDIGCHLFPNDEDKITDLHFDLLGGEIAPIDPNPGAYYNGRLSTGMEYPDFSTLSDDIRGAALGELLQVAAHRTEALTGPRMDVTLEKFLEIRFGKRVAALMGDAHRKILGGEARDVASPAWLAITARRAKIVDDIVAAELKSVPAFDDVILQSNAGDTMKFHRDAAGKFTARLFYPASGGMGGFISRAVARLEALGVTLSSETNVAAMDAKPGRPIGVTLTTGESLTADLIMWTTGAESLAEILGVKLHGKTINSLPMTVFYFDVPEDVPGPQTWINVFDNAVRVTRVSAPSRFAPGAAPAGRAYICAEATARMDEPLYQDPDAHAGMIWDQIKQIGFAHGPLPEHRLTRKAPVSFRHPRADYLDVRRDLDDALSRLPRIAEIEDWVFSKSECVRVCDRKLEALEHVV